MKCPTCNKEVEYAGNPYRPFCSERCKLIDLDNWLSERYRISTPITSEEESETTLAEQTPEAGRNGKADCD